MPLTRATAAITSLKAVIENNINLGSARYSVSDSGVKISSQRPYASLMGVYNSPLRQSSGRSVPTSLNNAGRNRDLANANLYSMVEIFCIFSETFDLELHGGPLVARDNSHFNQGIASPSLMIGYVTVTDDVPLLRAISERPTTTPVESFHDADDYKIVSFSPFAVGRGGPTSRHVYKKFLDRPLCPSDQLLGWNFPQAVLINIKGTGELFFDPNYESSED
ncbi:hypothetical protein B9Z19DRAFT_1136653 [Tuber borchii]|uniref:DUF7881 domain-containing protein n=1 Tax=Tuber borchii TaxID=42251 RepID=A0A2T6ZBD1_TUBBO|nr:hypothetical protein B9Z19DRAFT_1136653 [Tuber borchii]